MWFALFKNEFLFFKFLFNGVRYKKIQTDSNSEDYLLKHSKNSRAKKIQICALCTVKKNTKTNVIPISWKRK